MPIFEASSIGPTSKCCQISGMLLGGVAVLVRRARSQKITFLRATCFLPTSPPILSIRTPSVYFLNIQVSLLKRGITLIFSATSPAKVDVYQSKISLNHKYEILQKRVLLICNCSCSEVTGLWTEILQRFSWHDSWCWFEGVIPTCRGGVGICMPMPTPACHKVVFVMMMMCMIMIFFLLPLHLCSKNGRSHWVLSVGDK